MAHRIEANSVLHAHSGAILMVRFRRRHLSERSLFVSGHLLYRSFSPEYVQNSPHRSPHERILANARGFGSAGQWWFANRITSFNVFRQGLREAS